jgi:beta-fructofuranosidase
MPVGQTFQDAQGRTIWIGWCSEDHPAASRGDWAGVMTLPRVLQLDGDGMLRFQPAHEVECLRGDEVRIGARALPPGDDSTEPTIRGDALELDVEIETSNAQAAGICVRRSPDGQESTRIAYDRRSRRLILDRTQSSLDPNVTRDARSSPLALADGELLRLRIFIDRSIVEVFANDRVCLTSRIYPTRPDAMHVKLFTEGTGARLHGFRGWNLRSAFV